MELGGIDAEVLLGDGVEEATPGNIQCEAQVFDISFHPKEPYLAAGLVSGVVEVFQFRGNETCGVSNVKLHEGSVTGMEFTEPGEHLVTVSSDRTVCVLDCTTQKPVLRIKSGTGNPHKYGISTVNICSESLVATGDDDGMVVLWDLRARKVAAKYHEHGDYVSQLLYFSEVQQLISSSGDTCLGAYDVRAGQVIDFSVKRKDELTCMAFINDTGSLICGTPAGTLPLWKYGSWSRPYDVLETHPRDCECIVPYNDNIVLTGACDGLVRVLQMYPVRRNLCQLGGGETRHSIHRIRISHDRQLLAVNRQDNAVQFVDIAFLGDEKSLSQWRSLADQRHLATLREATKEEERLRALIESDNWKASAMSGTKTPGNGGGSCGGVDSGSDVSMSSSSSDDESDAAPSRGPVRASPAPKRRRSEAPSATAVGDSASLPPPGATASNKSTTRDSDDSDSEEPVAKTEKQKRTERIMAAKWLKEEKKRKVNFTYEKRRRRVSGFFSNLKD